MLFCLPHAKHTICLKQQRVRFQTSPPENSSCCRYVERRAFQARVLHPRRDAALSFITVQ